MSLNDDAYVYAQSYLSVRDSREGCFNLMRNRFPSIPELTLRKIISDAALTIKPESASVPEMEPFITVSRRDQNFDVSIQGDTGTHTNLGANTAANLVVQALIHVAKQAENERVKKDKASKLRAEATRVRTEANKASDAASNKARELELEAAEIEKGLR